mmetsp:Transcript_14768/g.34168  ORF Transcript_14768/g.34168 Transcript_14768/m.34168 type:complete len:137 (-) Transcript_14768:563-973(-)
MLHRELRTKWSTPTKSIYKTHRGALEIEISGPPINYCKYTPKEYKERPAKYTAKTIQYVRVNSYYSNNASPSCFHKYIADKERDDKYTSNARLFTYLTPNTGGVFMPTSKISSTTSGEAHLSRGGKESSSHIFFYF